MKKNNVKKNIFSISFKDGSFPGYNHIKCSKCNSLCFIEKITNLKLSNLHNKYYENWKTFLLIIVIQQKEMRMIKK